MGFQSCSTKITVSAPVRFSPSPANQEGRCKATWKSKVKLPWREASPPNHHKNKVDSDQ